MTDIVFTVGNALMGDDGAGPLLAELLERQPAPGWEAVDGGSAPENVMHVVRAAAPDRVLLVDAAEMGLPHGEIRRIDPPLVADRFLIDTHAIPIDFLVASLEVLLALGVLGVHPPAQLSGLLERAAAELGARR